MTKRANTVRMTEEAWAALERLASMDSRSMSAWLEQQVRSEALKKGCWVPRILTVKRDLSDS